MFTKISIDSARSSHWDISPPVSSIKSSLAAW